MTVDTLIQKLEAGETVTLARNQSLLNALSIIMNDSYREAAIHVDIHGVLMTLSPMGDFIKKETTQTLNNL